MYVKQSISPVETTKKNDNKSYYASYEKVNGHLITINFPFNFIL